MSFTAELQVVNDSKWYPNGLFFATREEAHSYMNHKLSTWYATTAGRVVNSKQPVTHKFENGKAKHI